MTFLRLILVRIGHLFKSIAALCSRILCFFSRRRDHIGELPYTVVVAKNNPSDISIPERVSTDSVGGWDNQWDTKQNVENKIEQWRSTKIAPPQVQETQEPDFFNDMQPDFKKAKKVILRPKMSSQDSVEKKNLFNYTDDVAVPPELELIIL
ncbi:unnamed protein product [Auanema sp. JU1783]|nr:unnamed protein product [Auanema sp. JU1783]